MYMCMRVCLCVCQKRTLTSCREIASLVVLGVDDVRFHQRSLAVMLRSMVVCHGAMEALPSDTYVIDLLLCFYFCPSLFFVCFVLCCVFLRFSSVSAAAAAAVSTSMAM